MTLAKGHSYKKMQCVCGKFRSLGFCSCEQGRIEKKRYEDAMNALQVKYEKLILETLNERDDNNERTVTKLLTEFNRGSTTGIEKHTM